jgi:hypothetical protein
LTRNGRWKMEDAVEVAPGKNIVGTSAFHNALFFDVHFTDLGHPPSSILFSAFAFLFYSLYRHRVSTCLLLSLSFFFFIKK